MPRARTPLAIRAPALWLSLGCGYDWVRPDAGGPVERLHLGAVTDLTGEGDLGPVARRHLRARLAGRSRPHLTERDGPTLEADLRLVGDHAAAYDSVGFRAVHEAAVSVELRLSAGGRPLWSAPPVTRRSPFPRGSTPLETRAARRGALEAATRDALDDALALFFAAPPPEAAP